MIVDAQSQSVRSGRKGLVGAHGATRSRASAVTAGSEARRRNQVAGSATVATAWITQKTLTRRELDVRAMRQREKLYGDFTGECSKLLIDAFTHTLDDPEKLLPLCALTNRIRLTASQGVFAAAQHPLSHIAEQYFSRNLTAEEMRQLAHSAGADP